jgi:hypothetical protein
LIAVADAFTWWLARIRSVGVVGGLDRAQPLVHGAGEQLGPVDAGHRARRGTARGQGPAQLPQLGGEQRAARVGAGHSQVGVERLRGQVCEQHPVTGGRDGAERIHVQVAELRHGCRAHGVPLRSERPQRGHQRVGTGIVEL